MYQSRVEFIVDGPVWISRDAISKKSKYYTAKTKALGKAAFQYLQEHPELMYTTSYTNDDTRPTPITHIKQEERLDEMIAQYNESLIKHGYGYTEKALQENFNFIDIREAFRNEERESEDV